MTTRFFTTVLFLVSFFTANAQTQTEKCNLTRSVFSRLYTVNVEEVICLAQNSDKDITIFYTYAEWCSPCRRKLPEAIKLAEKYNVDFYVLLMDREGDRLRLGGALQTLDSVYNNQLKAVIISDELYSERAMEKFARRSRRGFVLVSTGIVERDKYKNFLTLITPPESEIDNGMSKFIVLNKKGEVLLVTNHKDYEGTNDDSKLFERVVRVIENSRRK